MPNFDKCPTLAKSIMLNTKISKVLIMMGSNNNALANITLAKNTLANIGTIQELNSHTSPDHTGKSDSIYLNTAIIIHLPNTMTAHDIYITLKHIEQQCGRIHNSSIVALDLDIMAVFIDRWYIVKERIPFKAHETICMGMDSNLELSHCDLSHLF